MALHSVHDLNFQNITEKDQNAMGQSIYYIFYENYSAHYCTDEETDDVPNTFTINEVFIKCFLGSAKAKEIALANMPLHKPYAKKLVVECSSSENSIYVTPSYNNFVGSYGIDYLLDLLRVLDNVNLLVLKGYNHRNAGIF